MIRKHRRRLIAAACVLAAFAVWTAAVCRIDVRAIGPEGTAVGFAALNGSFHRLTGVHMTLYTLTDWLGLVPVAFAMSFALLGLGQWIRRKSIRRVDYGLLIMGGFYVLVAAVYIFFEQNVVNCRPVLIDGVLEPSYPSSTTLLTMCVMPTAAMQMNARLKNRKPGRRISGALAAFTAFMVIARMISGVHWLTDIVGGVLLSAGLVLLYSAAVAFKSE